jgi:hypothetical protein
MRIYLYLATLCLALFSFSACSNNSSSSNDDSAKLNSDPRFKGNVTMVRLLDSLAAVADPDINYFLSGKRASNMMANMPKMENPADVVRWETRYCFELLNAGNAEQCIQTLGQMIDKFPGGRSQALKEPEFKRVFDLLAVAHLRRGEDDNCVANHNNASCIVPLKPEAFHKSPDGSTMAIKVFQEILSQYPNDYQSKWLLNIAYMTLGKYPSEVPPKHYIDISAMDNENQLIKPFANVATDLGVDVNGLSGGAIIEDFNNDGFQDIFCSSYGLFDQCRLFVADGNGGYVDKTSSAMLTGLKGGLNTKQADFNNDGFIDILILRGAWLDKGGEWPNSLLKNNGDGTFSDITFAAGMVSFRPTETATWGDVNGDGLLDVFIANENNATNSYPCELFINNGNETFTDKSKEWGVDGNFGYAKAALFCDINKDGNLDLYISSIRGKNHLFVHRGFKPNSKEVIFEDIAEKVGIEKPFMSFPAMIFDYDHDGWDDILVTSFPLDNLSNVGGEVGAEMLGINTGIEKAKLYKNLGNEKFKDVTKEMGLDKMIFAMGFNFGDFNNDGYLDVYAGTGAFEFNSLVPNRAFLNQQGKYFAEVTSQSGLGHLQKGHGISFGDLDNDGDQDIYTTLGGAVEGDNAHNALFVNTNHGNNWITLKLQGKTTPRDGQNSRVMITTAGPQGSKSFHHTTGSGGSFGANSLQLEAGLGNQTTISSVEIWWGGNPSKKQTFTQLQVNSVYLLKEGENAAQRQVVQATALKGEVGKKSCCKK